MAQYQHLPIYKSTYELLQHITRLTKEFPRDYKHSLAAKLRDEAAEMDGFVGRELGLRLHPNKTDINRIERGINFLGYIVRPHARYVRRSTVLSAHQRIADLVDAADPAALRSTVNSYLGLMRHANTWLERGRLAAALREHGWRVDPARRRLILQRSTLQ